MTGCERITTALNYEEPDRVPLDIGGSTVTAISARLLGTLLDHFGVQDDARMPDCIQAIAEPPDSLKQLLGIDTTRVGPVRIPGNPFPAEAGRPVFEIHRRPWEFFDRPAEAVDRWGVRWRHRTGEPYFSQISWPLADNSREDSAGAVEPDSELLGERVGRFRFPVPEAESLGEEIHSALARTGERFPVLDRESAGIFEMSQRLRGMEQFFMDLLTEPSDAERLAEEILAYKLAYWNIVLTGIPDRPEYPPVVFEADDFGTSTSLLIAPELIRSIYLPRIRRLIDGIRALHPTARFCLHSCGAVRTLIPDFIEAGVDILNPVQYVAEGMDLAELKRDFGRDLVFWGGCIDTTRILPYGKPTEVADEVKRVIDIMAPGGGFIAAAVHNIQADVPLENLLALTDTVQEYGRK